MRKRIGIVAGVKNEGEVIEQFITHHLRLGFAKIFILDITSTDGTREILQQYAHHPQIVVEFSEAIDGTPDLHRQFRLKAYLDEDIDQIFYMDTDEFVVMEPKSTLDDIFGQIESNCYEIPRYNIVNPQMIRNGVTQKLLDNLHKFYFHTPRLRLDKHLPCPSMAWKYFITRPIPPKTITSKDKLLLSFGGHYAFGETITDIRIPSGIFIAHIPVSTLSRMEFKLKTRYAYFLKNPDWFKKFLWRYHHLCHAYQLGLTEKMHDSTFLNKETIQTLLERTLISRAKQLLNSPTRSRNSKKPIRMTSGYNLSYTLAVEALDMNSK